MFANEDTVIDVGETALIGLGIALDGEYLFKAHCGDISSMNTFMSGVYLKLCLRSSLGVKGLILPNGHGVIDMDYRDEIKMIIHNPFGLSREPSNVVTRSVNSSFVVTRGTYFQRNIPSMQSVTVDLVAQTRK